MNAQIRKTLEAALHLYAEWLRKYDPNLPVDIDAARAYLAAQDGERWEPVPGLALNGTDSKLGLILHQSGETVELILVNPYRPDTHFPFPAGHDVCRRRPAQPDALAAQRDKAWQAYEEAEAKINHFPWIDDVRWQYGRMRWAFIAAYRAWAQGDKP